jgi:hypothetical protein
LVTPKYSWTTMFRMARISAQGISGCAATTSLGTCVTASPMMPKQRTVAQLRLHGLPHDQVHAAAEDLLQPPLNPEEVEDARTTREARLSALDGTRESPP